MYASLDCNLSFDAEQDVKVGIGDPSSEVADAMENERMKIVLLHRAKGCSFGWMRWHGACCVEVDVRGVRSSDNVAFKIEACKKKKDKYA